MPLWKAAGLEVEIATTVSWWGSEDVHRARWGSVDEERWRAGLGRRWIAGYEFSASIDVPKIPALPRKAESRDRR